MMTILRTFLACAVAAAFAHAASAAEPLGIGTLPQGSLGYSIASAVAKVVTEKGGLQARAIGQGGSNVYIPQINAGELEFGTSNAVEALYAVTGTGNFRGQPNKNLRVASVLVPFRVGIMVRKDSDIRTLKDLAGRRFPTGYTSQKLVQVLLEAILATEGMKISELDGVPVPNFVKGADLLAQGKVEGVLLAPGSAIVKRTDAKVPVRFISLSPSEKGLAAMRAIAPGTYFALVKPQKRLTGIVEPVTLMGYEYVLVTGAHVPDDVVYTVVRALHDNKASLVAVHGIYRRFSPERMAVKLGIDYHPGAVKFYREKGLWPPRQ